MEQLKFEKLLNELCLKYSISSDLKTKFEEGAVVISCNKGNYRFFYDFLNKQPKDEYKNIPLLHWRNKRTYIELKNAGVA